MKKIRWMLDSDLPVVTWNIFVGVNWIRVRSLSRQRYFDPGDIWKVSFNDLFFIGSIFEQTASKKYSTVQIHSNGWPWNLIKNLILLGHRLILHRREGDFYLRVYSPRSKCPAPGERKIFRQAETGNIFILDWIIFFVFVPWDLSYKLLQIFPQERCTEN